MNILSSNKSSDTNALNVPLLQDQELQSLENAFPPTVVEQTVKKKFKFPKWCRPFGPAKKMKVEDRMNLNWVQKWLQYGRFPWKFIFHALLTAACTAMVFMQTNDQTPFIISMDATWYQLFFPDSFDYAGDYADNSFYFYDTTEIFDSVVFALEQHAKFPNFSVVPFEINPIGREPSMVAELTVYSYGDCVRVYDPSELNLNLNINTTVYYVSADDLGPFTNLSGEALQNFFYCMQSMSLAFGYKNTHLQYNHPLEYAITIQLVYDNSVQGGRIALTMSWTKSSLNTLPYTQLLQLSKAMLDLAIIFFALISQILSWVSIGKSFKIFASARRRLSRRQMYTSVNSPTAAMQIGSEITWGQLPIRTKLRFFNMWFVITILGNIANITSSMLDLFPKEDAPTARFQRLMLGVGTLLAWINLVRYLEFDKKYTVLISALQRGFPSALRFLLGTLPVFIGFALFGVAYFSEHSYKFSTFGTACVTLFGLQNGDDVQNTFSDTNRDFVVGRIYLAVFVFLSIYGVANIFIAIMDESYTASTRQAESERLKKKQQIAPSRDSDLNNDDDLWNAVLGLAKSSSSVDAPASPRLATDTTVDTNDVSGSGADSGESDSDDKDDKDDKGDSDKGEPDVELEKFMEALDAQHAKFREEMQASLAKFMAANSNAPSRPPKVSRKTSFASSPPKQKDKKGKQRSSSPSSLRHRSSKTNIPSASSSSSSKHPKPSTPSSAESSPIFPPNDDDDDSLLDSYLSGTPPASLPKPLTPPTSPRT